VGQGLTAGQVVSAMLIGKRHAASRVMVESKRWTRELRRPDM
jgi:hypothetical protein